MKVLWIVNNIFPYPAEKIGVKQTVFGGWLNGLANKLKDEETIKLAIAVPYNGMEIKEFYDGKITYYLIPGGLSIKYNSKMEKEWKNVNERFKPDLVHIHGTEYPHGLSFIMACPNVKIVTSIQGLVSVCSKVYYANLKPKEIIKNITVRDIVKRDSLFQQKKKFEQRGKYEIEIIKESDAIIGRTTWDYANTKNINKKAHYYYCNETLREKFYQYEWNIEDIEKHTIFCSQASYPIKGVHYLIEAVYFLKEKYPDIKLYIAGQNILDVSTRKAKLKRIGYAKYLRELIKKYNIEEQVVFTGLLNEEQMIKRLLKTNVFVLPSAIENSSNSLGEVMLLGMPCVASNTGGTMDILEHKKEGYLYPYTEPAICATYISKFFEDENLAVKLGQEARKTAIKRHNPIVNTENMVEIYKKVIGE